MNTVTENTTLPQRFTLKKAEILRSKKVIEKLFADGGSVLKYPLKMVFLETELPNSCPAQTAFTASKKNFKRAVHRNRIKRLLRNVYRLNKHLIYNTSTNKQLALFIIYIGKDLPEYHTLETAMKKGLQKISNTISGSVGENLEQK